MLCGLIVDISSGILAQNLHCIESQVMDDAEAAIRRVWGELAESTGQASRLQSTSATIIDDLVVRYSEPHRRYHTATHIMWVLQHVDDLLATSQADVDRHSVIASALFHDAVYVVKAAPSQSEPSQDDRALDDRAADSGVAGSQVLTNEARSARLAVAQLFKMGWSEPRLTVVAELIEATAAHESSWPGSGNLECAVLLDADLAILGADRATYSTYVAGVRAEYEHIDDEQWRVGRASVLRSFLAREHIFVTPAMAQRCELRARTNLTNELARLQAC